MSVRVSDSIMNATQNAHHGTELVKSAVRNGAARLLQRYVSAQHCERPRACGYTNKHPTTEQKIIFITSFVVL